MNAAVIIIGDEILNGQVTDINTGEIARALSTIGSRVVRVVTVGDNSTDIARAITSAVEADDVEAVLTTGGLGPTKDDITKGVFCALTGSRPALDKGSLAVVEAEMARRGVELNELTRSQAMLPESCEPITNTCGTAPGMWFEIGGKSVCAMPGVPFEAAAMLRNEVVARLARRFHPEIHFARRTLLLTGISESAVAERLGDWEDSLPEGFHLAYLPMTGYLRLRLDGCGSNAAAIEAEATRLAAEMQSTLADHYLADADLTPAAILLHEMEEAGLTFASAESCTGGSIAAAMTAIPGSSAVVRGGVVAYCNSVKESVLGVSGATMAELGAVSEPVVCQMALGAARLTAADMAVATSGIAGPRGAVPGKPVGTVCSAIAINGEIVAVTTDHFTGDRRRVVERTVNAVIIRAILRLREISSKKILTARV